MVKYIVKSNSEIKYNVKYKSKIEYNVWRYETL